MRWAPAASLIAEHPAVDVCGYPAEQLAGHPAHPGRPVLAHQVVVAADATAGDDDGLGTKLELAESGSRRRHPARGRRRLQHRATHPGDGATFDDEFVDAVAMGEAHLRMVQEPTREHVDDGGPGAPGDVEPRNRVAVSACVVTAAFRPADERERLQPALAEPAALLARREVDVGVRPLPGPVVLGTVEAGGAQPVLQREFVAVADAQPALFGAVDEEQPAERPEGLPAEVGGVLLVDDEHRAALARSPRTRRPARPVPLRPR